MPAFSIYLADKLLDHTFRNTAYTSPATVYVSLYTAISDAEAGTGTEVTGGSYARVAVTFGAPADNSGVREIKNSAKVDFGTATASWGTVTHFGIFDASSAGNALAELTALTVSKLVNNGDPVEFAVDSLVLTLD